MAPDVFVFGIVKAMLTVALIPPILKYVFGIEKKAKALQLLFRNLFKMWHLQLNLIYLNLQEVLNNEYYVKYKLQ